MTEEPAKPAQEFVMAVAGPGMSLLLAAVFFVLYLAVQSFGGPALIAVVLGYLATVNLYVGIFNLLPGFPMDGGRVLRSVLWGLSGDLLKATRRAARTAASASFFCFAR